LNGQVIAPFLLLPFIENSFKHCGQMTEQFWINLDIRIEGKNFSMKLANGRSEKIDEQPMVAANDFANVQKRLAFLYPDNHELKMTMEQEMCIVFLNIRLDDALIAIDEKEINSSVINYKKDKATILKYASE